MKQKDFIFNICLLIFLNLLIKPFWILGIDVGVQNQVGAEEYGLYFAIFNFTFLFNMILDMGITNFNNRNIAQNNQLLRKHLSGILTLKLCLGVIYFICIFIVAVIIGYRGFQLKLLFWMAINQFLSTFILYLRSNISALLMFKTDSILSILDRLIMIILCSILLWGGITKIPFRIEWFVYSQTIAYLITAATAFFIVFRKAKPFHLTWQPLFFKAILKKSFPFAILFLLMAFYNRIDSVMIERILPKEISSYQSGIYASAFRLLDALVMISYLFSVILLPLFSKMTKEKEDINPIVKSSFRLIFFFSVTTVIILEFYGKSILSILYDKNIEESYEVFKLLIPCLIPISFTYIFGTLLTANGNMRMLNITSIAGIIINMTINCLLIPKMQAQGAAIASISTQSVIAFLQILIVFKTIHIPIKSISLSNCVAYIILLVPSIYFIHKIDTSNSILSLIIVGGVALGLAIATKLFSLQFIRKLIEEKTRQV